MSIIGLRPADHGPSLQVSASPTDILPARCAAGERLSRAALHEVAASVSARAWLWAGLHLHAPVGPAAVRLAATEDVDVWVMGWTAGQAADLHDHGESAGVLVVVEGALEEQRLVHGHLRPHRLSPGRRRCLPVGIAHHLRSTGDTPAVSIHVHSPPLGGPACR